MIEKLSNLNFEEINFMGLDSPINQDSIAEKIESLMPSIWIMIATLASVLLLLIILTKFLYNPVKKMVQNRKDFIKKNIDDSIKAKDEAFKSENEARLKLEESRTIGSEIIFKAKMEADLIKTNYIKEAKEEATRIIKEAKDDIKSKQIAFEQEAYNEILSVAIEISQKIIKDKISEKETKKYLDEYLGKN